jgi:hypothetical protein
VNAAIEAPAGLSNHSVASGGRLIVTFAGIPVYVRVAVGNGTTAKVAWTADGLDNNGFNTIGGDWENVLPIPGQLSQLVLEDTASAGALPVQLLVVMGRGDGEAWPEDLSIFEGATEALASAPPAP